MVYTKVFHRFKGEARSTFVGTSLAFCNPRVLEEILQHGKDAGDADPARLARAKRVRTLLEDPRKMRSQKSGQWAETDRQVHQVW